MNIICKTKNSMIPELIKLGFFKFLPKTSIIFVVSMILFNQNVLAQGGSNYSIFGLGDIDVSPCAAYDGLAGTSIAFPIGHSVNSINPALWTKNTETRLMTGYRFSQHIVEDNQDNILYQNNGRINGISMLFMIDTAYGLAASFGFNPYSSVNYLIQSNNTTTVEGSKIEGYTAYLGKGGVTMGYLGGAIKLFDNLSVGAMAFATFGVINTTQTTYFNDAAFYSSINQTDNRFSGWGLRVGGLYELFSGFNVGAYIEQHNKLEFEKELIYKSDSQVDTSFKQNYSISLPNSFGLGVSYLTGKFRIGADYKFFGLKNMDFNPGPFTEYRNMQIFSAAVSRLGSKSPGAVYLDKVTYNFGLGYKQLYYKIRGTGIDEIYGSLGMNFPLPGTGIIDASFTLGSRGVASDQLLHEYFGRFSVDISIGETWFKPFKREY